jgi:hypothetical protein
MIKSWLADHMLFLNRIFRLQKASCHLANPTGISPPLAKTAALHIFMV